MRWFGGFSNPTAPVRAPDDRATWPHAPGCWSVGAWPQWEFRTTRTGRHIVAVIGPCAATDAEIARLANHGVPDDVAWRWAGSYTTVEVTDGHVKVWTDLGGAWPVYLTNADGGVYWASSSRALAGLTGVGPDLDRLAAWLVAPTEPLLLTGRSMFDRVSLVPAGCRLTLSARDGTAAVHRVWTPQPGARLGSTTQRLRAELAAAASVRIHAAAYPTVDLSGGIDSTALAVLAHEAARPGQRVTGVTVHPAGHASGGDVDYARLAAKRSGIAHRLMPLYAPHAPYTALDVVPCTNEPAPSTIAHARLSAQLRWMREELGTDCHLTGDGGDSLMCSPPIMLADLFATGRTRRGLAEVIRWARLRRLPVWPLLRAARRTARRSRRLALADLCTTLATRVPAQPVHGDIGWCATDAPPTWASTDALGRAATLAAVWGDQVIEPAAGAFCAAVAAEGMAEVGRSARADVELAEALGVPLHNPFIDSRVVDAYLSVPLDERPGPADYKPILRDALADLFPPELAERTTKGDFNPDHYQGMRMNLAALCTLADGRLAALGFVDPQALRRTLTMTAAGLPVPQSHVEPAVAAEVWLRAIDAAPEVAWSPVPSWQGAA